MAYPVSVGDIIQVSIEGTCDGQQFISLFHYLFFSGPAVVDGAQQAKDVTDAFMLAGAAGDKYLACIAADVADMQCYAQWIFPQRYLRQQNAGGPFAGLAANVALTPNISVAITKRGELANRHSIGTLHMPAVPLDFLTAGLVNGAGLADYNALALNLDDTLVTVGTQEYHPLIFNRAAPGDSVRITSANTRGTARISRRRTVGLGS